MPNTVTYHRLDLTNARLLADTTMFDHAVDPEQLRAFVTDPGHELVFAMQGNTALGFASGTVLLHPDKPPSFFINEVGVDAPHRRQGVATALCQKLIERARAIGCKGIWLATEEENAPARALYTSLEARETNGIVVYDWDGAMDAEQRS